MFHKSFNVALVLAMVFGFGACSLDLRIPKGMPPQVVVPPKMEKPVTEPVSETPVLDPGRNVMVEVLIPDSERKTEALIEQYKANLEAMEKNLD